MKEIAYIFIGGGVGSVLRYLAQISINERMSGIGFPFSWGTFIVNIAGSLLIGLFYSVSERWNLSMEMRLFLTTGLCGGFTTFSTFSNDGLSLLRGEFYGTFQQCSAFPCFFHFPYLPFRVVGETKNHSLLFPSKQPGNRYEYVFRRKNV